MSNMYNDMVCKDESHGVQTFDEAIKALEVEAMNFATRFIKDSKVRAEYIFKSQSLSAEYLSKIQMRELSTYQAAFDVNKLRDEIMKLARLESSDIGKSIAFRLKETSKTLEPFCEHYATKLYSKNFTSLTAAQQEAVYVEIVKAVGRTRPSVNSSMQHLSRVGKGLFVLSLAVSVYNITTSDDKLKTATNEGVIIGAGFAGGALGGATAGLACGPGAPVCVTVGVFVGGLLGGFGADMAFDYFF